MKNTIGNHITFTLFGESHGKAIGGVIDGVPAGIRIDMDLMLNMIQKRKAAGKISTGRHEADLPEFLSGVKDGVTEGSSIAFVIANNNVHKTDYNSLANTARPGHADYAAYTKYHGFEDASGGGHFSGRLTAPMVVVGALCTQLLKEQGIVVGTHIQKLKDVSDDAFDENHLVEEIALVNGKDFAVLNEEAGKKMIAVIEEARMNLDSVGGVLDTAVVGLPAGIGEPEFDSLESQISHAIFSIPAVKGISFGEGFNFANLYGSQANDAFAIKDGEIVTTTNHNGGINGGISNGMPIRFHTVIKPTPSIAQKQHTVNFVTKEEKEIEIQGRHDPAIIHRARVVVDSLTAFVLVDMMMEKYGTEFFGGKKS